MEATPLAIPLGFIVLAVLLCWQLIGGKWKWWAKLVVIVAVPAYGLAVWASIPSYQGWPASEKTPRTALVFWAAVREPDPKANDKGAVFVWLVPVPDGKEEMTSSGNPLGYVPSKSEPRAYRLPYSKSAHQRAVEAQDQIMRTGQPMLMERGKPESHGRDGHANPGSGRRQQGQDVGEGDEGEPGDPDDEILYYPLPKPRPTPKDP